MASWYYKKLTGTRRCQKNQTVGGDSKLCLLFSEILLDNPKLYQNIAKNRLLSPWQGLLWFLEGLFHSVVTFFGFYLLWTFNLNSIPVEFTTQEKFSFGLAVYQCVLVNANLNWDFRVQFYKLLDESKGTSHYLASILRTVYKLVNKNGFFKSQV